MKNYPGDPEVLYEDNHLIVINKPFCMPSQGDPSGDLNVFDWIKEYIRRTYDKPGNVYLGLLHRLDRPTGGLLVLAKTSKAAARMSAKFQKKEIEKTYYAVTEKAPEPAAGEISSYLYKLRGRNIMRSSEKEVKGSKKAVLEYRTLQRSGERALVEVHPKTGRRHQIRVQLASRGASIVGDKKYGNTEFLDDKSIALLAAKLKFIHPVGDRGAIEAELSLPSKFPWNLFQ